MQPNCAEKWSECLALIRKSLNNDTRFETWFAPTKAVSLQGTLLTLELPSYYCYELYEDQFFDIFSSALHKVFGKNVRVSYRVKMLASDPKSKVTLTTQKIPETKSETPVRQQEESGFASNLNTALTFDNYCVADCNKLPFSIAENISRKPVNSNFNPFFLYGDVGVGKTHLMQAIGLEVKSRFPEKKVLFLPMREFQRLYANAVLKKQIPSFINWFMQMDVLLFDDLQELSNKTKTLSDALFPIFNHLHQNGRQLVFTCDRAPMELEGMEDRLIDRFKWGITEKLEKPDLSLRKKILTFKAKKNGLQLPANVIDYIVHAPINSVREIEGIVLGMMTRTITMGGSIDLDLVREVMKNSIKAPVKKSVNFDMIVEATADRYALDADVIFSKSKLRDVAEARMVIMHLAQKLLGLSTSSIGTKLGRKHSTVIHGLKSISEKRNSSAEVAAAISEIEKELCRV